MVQCCQGDVLRLGCLGGKPKSVYDEIFFTCGMELDPLTISFDW